MKNTLLISILLFSLILKAQIPQSSNLVGEYKFNADTNDTSGNAYNGQTFGAPTLVQDRFGNSDAAYSLDGVDDYLYFGNSMLSEWPYESNGFIMESFTISLWAKSSQSASEVLLGFGEELGCCYYGMVTFLSTHVTMNSSNFPFYSNNSWVNTSGKGYDGQWHHYVVVWDYDTGYRRVYIDGALAGQYRQVENGNTLKRFRISNYGLAVGRDRYRPSDPSYTGNTFTGSVDEVRVWNTDLSTSDISSLYSYDNNSANYQPTIFNVVNRYGKPTSTAGEQLNQYGQVGVGNSYVNKNGKIISF